MSPSATLPTDLPKDGTATYDPTKSGNVTRSAHAPEMSFVSGKGLSKWTVSSPSSAAANDAIALSMAGAPQASYTLHRMLGRGGMGEVWEAEQQALSRRVAVKRVRQDAAEGVAGGYEFAEMQFRQEALIAAQIEHPNVVPVHDLGVDENGNLLLAMKLVDGRPWDKVLADDFPNMSEADLLGKHLAILRATAQAVAFAHDRGIIHRDIKPSQVMVGDFGEVVLMDWGLAIVLNRKDDAPRDRAIPLPTRTTASSPSGTPALMAPEQTEATADRVGPWTDVYLLGGTLYFLLTGTYPHAAASARQSFLRARIGDIEPPSLRAPQRRHPSDLVELCLKALELTPEKRVPSALDFLKALDDYTTGSSRRREAQSIVHEVASRLGAGSMQYEDLAGLSGRLDQAARLYADHPYIPTLRDRLSADYTRVALTYGDLALASVHANHVSDPAVRDNLVTGIRVATRKRERREAQRRWLMFAAVALLALVAVGAVITLQQQQRATQSESRRVIAQERADQQQRQASLMRDLYSYVSDESELAAEMVDRFRLPLMSHPNERLTMSAAAIRQDAEKLFDRREDLRGRRADLERLSPGSLPPEAVMLTDADALWMLISGTTIEHYRHAAKLFEASVARQPGEPEPRAGLAVARAWSNDIVGAIKDAQAAIDIEKAREFPREKALAEFSMLMGNLITSDTGSQGNNREYLEGALRIMEPSVAMQLIEVVQARMILGPVDYAADMGKFALRLLEPYRQDYEVVVGSARTSLALILGQAGRYAESLEILETLEREESDSNTLPMTDRVTTHLNIASMHRSSGRPDLAFDILEKWMPLLEEAMDEGDYRLYRARSHYAITLRQIGRTEDAANLFKSMLDDPKLAETMGPIHLAEILGGYSLTLRDMGRFDDAVAASKAGIELVVQELGSDSFLAFTMRINLAKVLGDARRSQEAMALLDETFAKKPEEYDATHPEIMTGRNLEATLLFEAGKKSEAIALADELASAVEDPNYTHRAKTPPDLYATLIGNWIGMVASTPTDPDKLRRRLELYEEASRSIALLPMHRYKRSIYLGSGYLDLKEYALAVGHMEEALRQFDDGQFDTIVDPRELDALYTNLGVAYTKLGHFAKGRDAYEIAERRQVKPGGKFSPALSFLRANIARSHLREGQALAAAGAPRDQAEACYLAGLNLTERLADDPRNLMIQWTRDCHAAAWLLLGYADRAEPILRQLKAAGYDNAELWALVRTEAPELSAKLQLDPAAPVEKP